MMNDMVNESDWQADTEKLNSISQGRAAAGTEEVSASAEQTNATWNGPILASELDTSKYKK